MRKKRTDHTWEVMQRSIYVLIFEDEKRFYVGRTVMPRLWHAYDYHYRERQIVTRSLFRKYKKSGRLPAMYFLEYIVGRDCDAFQRCILWSRYFAVQHEYRLLAGEAMADFIVNMDVKMKAEYQQLREIPFDFLCSAEKSLFPNFKSHHCLPKKSLNQPYHKSIFAL